VARNDWVTSGNTGAGGFVLVFSERSNGPRQLASFRLLNRPLIAMDVEYELTPDDLYAFQWRAAYRSPNSRRIRRRGYLYVLLPLLVIGLLPSVGPGGIRIARINLLFLVIVLPIVAGLYWIFVRRTLELAIRKEIAKEAPEKGRLGRHRVVLSSAGIDETTAVGQTVTRWAGVDRIEEDEHYIFIYTAPSAAHIIPKRAFAGSRAEDFYDIASRYAAERSAAD
jgi:YcxB-like protein